MCIMLCNINKTCGYNKKANIITVSGFSTFLHVHIHVHVKTTMRVYVHVHVYMYVQCITE